MTGHDRDLELNALVDGELGRREAADLLAHVAGCTHCAASLAGLLALRGDLARMVPPETAPASAARRVERELARRTASRRRIPSALFWPAAAAVAAAMAASLLLVFPSRPDEGPTLRAVADAARRASPSTMAPSSPATVPAPANVGAYRLLATRDDVVAGHASKVLVYGGPGAGGDVTLVAWKSEGEAAHDVKRDEAGAATVDYWNDGATEYWATGLRGADVEAFVAAYRNAPG